jgi:hypothetical protein
MHSLTSLVCLETRTAGAKQVWELIHSAVDEDCETAMALIEAAELQLP